MLAAFACGILNAGCGDGDSFLMKLLHTAKRLHPGRVAGASPVIRHAAVGA
ncbi:MAG: hypothetical protein ACLR8P_23255 [Clostridium fessum]